MTHRDVDYLRIPADYCRALGGVRWSCEYYESLETCDGRWIASGAEVVYFLEGWSNSRPIQFGHIVHLLCLLKHGEKEGMTVNGPHGRPARLLQMLKAAFEGTGKSLRNAGAFFSMVCRDLPPAALPLHEPVGENLLALWSCLYKGNTMDTGGEVPPLSPADFEDRILRAVEEYPVEHLFHWFRHGRGPVGKTVEPLVRTLIEQKPRPLEGTLAQLAQRERLRGAVRFVPQLLSALTLPPRRHVQSELPMGGYADMDTRGKPEEIVPSQFVLDDLEFIRRFAQNELLYFRKEEPRAPVTEELVVLLDQGVRTWGTVRLVLTAAVFALGQMASRRKIAFRIAATSENGLLRDLTTTPQDELGKTMEASDLSPNPGLALERVLEEKVSTPRDVVLLTHPRNLLEPDVHAASLRINTPSRLFALAVDAHGTAQLSMIRHGLPVVLRQMRVDLSNPVKHSRTTGQRTPWTGDVEPIPIPFCIRQSRPGPSCSAFDYTAKWFLLSGPEGILQAYRTDDQEIESLPRACHDRVVLRSVKAILGVAGGFVVLGLAGQRTVLAHYDFESRHCTCRLLEGFNQMAHVEPAYFRDLHCVAMRERTRFFTFDLGTGKVNAAGVDTSTWTPADQSRSFQATHRFLHEVRSSMTLRVVSEAHSVVHWGALYRDPTTGQLSLFDRKGRKCQFTPVEDGIPIYRHSIITLARTAGERLAVHSNGPHLRVYSLPDGALVGRYLVAFGTGFTFSQDGTHLATMFEADRWKIQETVPSAPPKVMTLPRGSPNAIPGVDLGECWLLLRYPGRCVLIRWDRGHLEESWREGKRGTFVTDELRGTTLSRHRVRARGSVPTAIASTDYARYLRSCTSTLVVVLDAFGQVILFDRRHHLLAMFHAVNGQLAGWMPDGTCFGPPSLLGRPETPGARRHMGEALLEAWRLNEETQTWIP